MIYYSEIPREFFSSYYKMRFVHRTFKSSKGYQFDIGILNSILLKNLIKYMYGDPFGCTVSLMWIFDERLSTVPIPRAFFQSYIYLVQPKLIYSFYQLDIRVAQNFLQWLRCWDFTPAAWNWLVEYVILNN